MNSMIESPAKLVAKGFAQHAPPAADLSARERELRRFSRRAGASIKAAFATARLIRYLRPQGKSDPVSIGAILIGSAGGLLVLSLINTDRPTALLPAFWTVAAFIVWIAAARWLWARMFFFRW